MLRELSYRFKMIQEVLKASVVIASVLAVPVKGEASTFHWKYGGGKSAGSLSDNELKFEVDAFKCSISAVVSLGREGESRLIECKIGTAKFSNLVTCSEKHPYSEWDVVLTDGEKGATDIFLRCEN